MTSFGSFVACLGVRERCERLRSCLGPSVRAVSGPTEGAVQRRGHRRVSAARCVTFGDGRAQSVTLGPPHRWPPTRQRCAGNRRWPRPRPAAHRWTRRCAWWWRDPPSPSISSRNSTTTRSLNRKVSTSDCPQGNTGDG